MQRSDEVRDEIRLVGISMRTSYTNETDPARAKIGRHVEEYFTKQIFDKIPNRKKPFVTYCTYSDYEDGYKGGYRYFIGEEVSGNEVPEGLETLVIPKQRCVKFTTNPGPMPQVIIDGWTKIWQMNEKDLGGARKCAVDFELYDERAVDQQNSVLDIFVGIE